MSTWPRIKLLLLTALLGAAPVAYANYSTWTSAAGDQVQARFVGIENGQVVLQPEAGEKIAIGIRQLTAADQARARDLHAAGQVAAPETLSRLPVLSDGPGRNHHAFYEHANFDAWVAADGRLFIHPKENRQRVGEPFHIDPRVIEHVAGAPAARLRHFSEFKPAAVNPRAVTYEAVGDLNNTAFTYRVEYTFNQNAICVSMEMVDPRQAERDYRTRANFRFGQVLEIHPDTPNAERVKLLQNHQLRWRGETVRGWQQQNFHDSLTLRVPADQAEISGPWGNRRILFRGENRRQGHYTQLWNYSGQTLNEGYVFHHNAKLGSRTASCCVTID